jgi:hypothetical protein
VSQVRSPFSTLQYAKPAYDLKPPADAGALALATEITAGIEEQLQIWRVTSSA